MPRPSFFIAKRSWYPGAGVGSQKRCQVSAEARSAKVQERIRKGPRSTAGQTAFHDPHQEFDVAGLDQEGGGEIAPPPDQPRIVIDQIRER